MDAARALEICRDAVACSTSDDVYAGLLASREGATRFANGAITQAVAHREATLRVRVAFGRRRAEVEVHRFDRDSLREAVARAEAIARLTPEDAEHLPPVEPSAYRDVPQGLPATADTDPADRAAAVARAVAAGDGPGLSASGAFTTEGDLYAFANSRGAHGVNTTSTAEVHATVIGPTSSGWAREASRDRAEVDPERIARRARRLAELARDPRELDPGEYRVVLAPAAVAELLVFTILSADAKAADEGRSVFSGKEGAKLASDRVTIRSLLADPACPGVPFDGDGAPLDDTAWFDRGVLRSLVTTRVHAAATGRRHTPFPGTLAMDGTDRDEDELVAQVDRGLYVTRFWYTRMVDPMQLLLTGMTRDGLFLIEDGRIVSGLKHLRWNDSPLRVLSAVADVGRAEVTHPWWFLARVPSLLVDGFRFTSGTSF
jgi:predicted Zn-dependent protease